MYRRSSSAGDAFAMGAASGVLLIALGLLVLAIWVTVKAINLLVRVYSRYPHNRALHVALGSCLGLWALTLFSAVVTSDAPIIGVFLTGAMLSTLALLLTAWVVEVYYDERFRRERPQGLPIMEILKEPWWTPAA